MRTPPALDSSADRLTSVRAVNSRRLTVSALGIAEFIQVFGVYGPRGVPLGPLTLPSRPPSVEGQSALGG